jgi:protein SCO1
VSKARRLTAILLAATSSWLPDLGMSASASASTTAGAIAQPHLNPWPDGAPSPDFHLSDLQGRPRTLRSFHGFVTVVTFGYANCPGACSVELQKLAMAMHSLGARRDRVRVVFVTLDPTRDSPALLRRFVHTFDPAFVALRGDAGQTDAAIKSFSIESARVPGNENYLIDHTVEEFVFDKAGHLQLVGASNSTADDVAHDVASLLGVNRVAGNPVGGNSAR